MVFMWEMSLDGARPIMGLFRIRGLGRMGRGLKRSWEIPDLESGGTGMNGFGPHGGWGMWWFDKKIIFIDNLFMIQGPLFRGGSG